MINGIRIPNLQNVDSEIGMLRRKRQRQIAANQARYNIYKSFVNGKLNTIMISKPQNNLSFRNPIICYILENANAKIIEKLQKTCKLFYNKLPYAVFQKAVLNADNRIHLINKESKFVMSEFVDNEKNLVISESIDFYSNKNYSIFVSKIYRCSISILSLSKTAIDFDAYKIFTESGKIKKLVFDLVIVTDREREMVPLEDLLSYIPNAEEIDIHSCHVTFNTFLKLKMLPWKKKLSLFNLTFLDCRIDITSYIEFIKKNLASSASFNLTFNPVQRDLEKRLEKELMTWKPKPNFCGLPDNDNLYFEEYVTVQMKKRYEISRNLILSFL